MVTQEEIVDWYVSTQILPIRDDEKSEFFLFLEKGPDFIQKIMLKNIPSIIESAARHFKDGLEIKNHDFQQFSLALAEGLRKKFLSEVN